MVVERLLYARLYRAAELDQVLLTIGLVFVMISGVTLLFGPENRPLALPAALQGQIDLGVVKYRTYSLVLIAAGTTILAGLWLGFERTRLGAQIRAAVDNRGMAESLGLDIDRLFSLTFAFGSGMAALGGGLGAEFLGLDPQYALKYLVYFLIVLVIDHDMDLVLRFAERITVMVSGAIFASGSPAEIGANPDVRAVYLGQAARG